MNQPTLKKLRFPLSRRPESKIHKIKLTENTQTIVMNGTIRHHYLGFTEINMVTSELKATTKFDSLLLIKALASLPYSFADQGHEGLE